MEQLSLTEIKSICHKIVERKLKRSFQIPSQERENIIDEESFSEDPDDILLRDPEKSNSFEQIFDSYESFLRSSNIVDFSDVLRSLSSELTRNSEIQEAFSSKKRAIVLINGKGFSQAEVVLKYFQLVKRSRWSQWTLDFNVCQLVVFLNLLFVSVVVAVAVVVDMMLLVWCYYYACLYHLIYLLEIKLKQALRLFKNMRSSNVMYVSLQGGDDFIIKTIS